MKYISALFKCSYGWLLLRVVTLTGGYSYGWLLLRVVIQMTELRVVIQMTELFERLKCNWKSNLEKKINYDNLKRFDSEKKKRICFGKAGWFDCPNKINVFE